MYWLLACIQPPAVIDLPLTPPPAVNATAVPVNAFIGPLQMDGVAINDLCGASRRATLLKTGSFGWRVLMLGPYGPVPIDAIVPADATVEYIHEQTAVRVKQWIAMDAILAERCGTPRTPTPVLLAVRGESRFDVSVLFPPFVLEGLDLRLLVTDAQPSAPVPAPPQRTQGMYLSLAASTAGWAVLGSDSTFTPTVHADAGDAVKRVAAAGYPEVLLTSTPTTSWSTVVQGIDALAGVGIEPRLALTIGENVAPQESPPSDLGPTRIMDGEVISVLHVEPPGYASPSPDGRPGGLLLQVIGTETNAP